MHRRDRLAAGRRERKRLRRGRLLLERSQPVGEEVDRVDEHEARRGLDRSRRQEVLDPLLRLLRDPAVDARACGVGLATEVDRFEWRAVRGLGLVEERRLERIRLRAEQPVRDAELEWTARVL